MMMNNIKKELFIIPAFVLLLSGCFGSSSSSDDDDGDNNNIEQPCATGTPDTVLNLVLPEIVYTEVDETEEPNDTALDA